MVPVTNKITPIPLRDDIVGLGTKTLNQTWELWFRKLYDVVIGISTTTQGTYSTINSISATPIDGFNYCLDGNRFFFNYKGLGGIEINLPYPILYDVTYKWGSITSGQKRLILPTFTTTTILNEWFFIAL